MSVARLSKFEIDTSIHTHSVLNGRTNFGQVDPQDIHSMPAYPEINFDSKEQASPPESPS
jgi:hypothetical protein